MCLVTTFFFGSDFKGEGFEVVTDVQNCHLKRGNRFRLDVANGKLNTISHQSELSAKTFGRD